MWYYFELQYKRGKRWFNAVGIHHIPGILISTLLFIVLSMLLFYKTDLAPYIYILLALSFIQQLSDRIRNEHLKLLYQNRQIRTIRLIENVMVGLPFMLYLIYEQQFLLTLALAIGCGILSFLLFNRTSIWVIPTPFKKLGFEYIVGFRQYLWIILILYFVIFQAIIVGNFNLGIVCLAFISIFGMAFYFKPEQLFFVWIHKMSFQQFIRHKMVTALLCAYLLTLPALITLLIFFLEQWLIISSTYLIVGIINSSIVLAKYSSYPREMNIPQTILFVMSIVFPPMLPFTFWIFYRQSKRRLEPILSC